MASVKSNSENYTASPTQIKNNNGGKKSNSSSENNFQNHQTSNSGYSNSRGRNYQSNKTHYNSNENKASQKVDKKTPNSKVAQLKSELNYFAEEYILHELEANNNDYEQTKNRLNGMFCK